MQSHQMFRLCSTDVIFISMMPAHQQDSRCIVFQIKLQTGDIQQLFLSANECEQEFKEFCRQYTIDQDQAQIISRKIKETIDAIYEANLKANEDSHSAKNKSSSSDLEIKSNTDKRSSQEDKSGVISKKISNASLSISKDRASPKVMKTEPKMAKDVSNKQIKSNSSTPLHHKTSTKQPAYVSKHSMKHDATSQLHTSSPGKCILLKDHLNDHSEKKQQNVSSKPKIVAPIHIPQHLLKKKQNCGKCVQIVDQDKPKKLSPKPADYFYSPHQRTKHNCKRHDCEYWQHSQGKRQKSNSPNRIPIASLCYSPSFIWDKTLREDRSQLKEPLPTKYAVHETDPRIKNYYTNFKLMCSKVQL